MYKLRFVCDNRKNYNLSKFDQVKNYIQNFHSYVTDLSINQSINFRARSFGINPE